MVNQKQYSLCCLSLLSSFKSFLQFRIHYNTGRVETAWTGKKLLGRSYDQHTIGSRLELLPNKTTGREYTNIKIILSGCIYDILEIIVTLG